MLSYQHSYHAGCQADVHKHSALATLLEHMIAKNNPLTYMETHAGRGFYDLAAPQAQKTGEYKAGIETILKEETLPASHPFMRVLQQIRQIEGPTAYPGSPTIAEALLRPYDSIHLMELHPTEVESLRDNMYAKNVHIHHRNGYEGVLALAPPTPRRGIVFIDPSYEVKKEYQQVTSFVQKLSKKWPEAVIAIWYPMLSSEYYADLIREVESLQLKNTSKDLLHFTNKKTPEGLYGSGIIFINTPYGLEEKLKNTNQALQKLFAETV